ncbi:hypothetical protein [uncultured Draconibacterium sp.]|uniref:hypothetical protein n=1 Tax=uncultured Draconibacterium sp. TaxID=1573823 RepID=UPI0032610B93
MSFSIKYKPLFEVNLYHKYFLNNGAKDFFSMNDTEKEMQLTNYELSDLFSIVPSANTLKKLLGHQIVFKSSGYKLLVWVKVASSNLDVPFIPLSENLELSFLLKLKTYTFNHFTDLGLQNSGQLLYFSNRRLLTETGNFPLIKRANNTTAVTDDYRLNELSQKAVLDNLAANEKQNLLGIIRIGIKGETGSYDILRANGKLRSDQRIFNLVFANRKTTWRYYFKTNQQVNNHDDVKKENGNSRQLITRTEKPLTARGFISVKLGNSELPNPDVLQIIPDDASSKIYSEIHM